MRTPRTRLVWVLPLLLLGCKKRESEAPEDPGFAETNGYGSQPWTESSTAGVQPLAVCEHLARMVAAEAGVSELDLDPRMIQECEAELAIEANVRGTENWNAIANCVLQARSEADIDFCDRSYPMPGNAGPGPSGPGPSGPPVGERELAVCDHMIEVFMLESAAETGEVPEVTRDERDAVVQECAAALVLEQAPALGPAEYERLLGCIEQARSSAQMQACE